MSDTKIVTFQDINHNEIQITSSLDNCYDLYISSWKGDEATLCIHLNRYQARILINALENLMVTPQED